MRAPQFAQRISGVFVTLRFATVASEAVYVHPPPRTSLLSPEEFPVAGVVAVTLPLQSQQISKTLPLIS